MSFGHLSRSRNCAAFVATILMTTVLSGLAAAHNQIVGSRTSDQFIDDASRAKTNGQPALAYALLHQAVRIAPDNSLARWQLGQMKVDGEWLSIEEAQRRAEADPRQAKYHERKETLGESPQGQLALARWCRGNKLEDEAQFHWSSVLSVDPNNKEALRAVGMRWHDGELKTVAQIKDAKKESVETKQASRSWGLCVGAWMRALSDKKEAPLVVLNEIRAVKDITAIPAFESVTLNSSLTGNEKNTTVRRLSVAFVSALDKMREEAGTNSLLRHAVLSSYGDVRAEAIGDLRYRPLDDFVPTLLDNLTAPMQSAYRVVKDPDGSVHYLHSIYREGPFTDWSYRSERSIYQPGSMGAIAANFMPGVMPSENLLPGLSSVANRPARGVSQAGAARSARSYEEEIKASERQVADANEKTAALNERIIAVLTGTTEQNLGSEARPWWSWWQDYTDYYHGGSRPVLSTVDSSSDYILPEVPQSSGVECFAAVRRFGQRSGSGRSNCCRSATWCYRRT